MTTYKTRCGGTIHISPRAKNHLQAHPEVLDLLQSAIKKISLPTIDQNYEGEIDLGRVIGRSGVVNTTLLGLEDQALFACRRNRAMPSRVAPAGKVGEETTKIVVLARASGKGKHYELITSWIGTLAKKEPWDRSITSPEEFRECLAFWSSHALVHDPDVMGPAFESSWSEVLSNSR
jgi:hypothetical protein